jgi:hypothetical protein
LEAEEVEIILPLLQSEVLGVEVMVEQIVQELLEHLDKEMVEAQAEDHMQAEAAEAQVQQETHIIQAQVEQVETVWQILLQEHQ